MELMLAVSVHGVVPVSPFSSSDVVAFHLQPDSGVAWLPVLEGDVGTGSQSRNFGADSR